MRFVTIKRLAELSGYSEKAIRRKIDLGIFLEDVHFFKAPDSRIHFNVDAYEQWLQQESLSTSHALKKA